MENDNIDADVEREAPPTRWPDRSPTKTTPTPPRYESGTCVVFPSGCKVAEVVDRAMYGKKPLLFVDDWFAYCYSDGHVECGTDTGWQELPPRPTLQEGLELTGKAAKIDGTQELAEGEYWVSFGGSLYRDQDARGPYNQWRHIARKVEPKEEPADDAGASE